MRNLVLILALLTILGIISCDVDPLGIEKNVLMTKLDKDTNTIDTTHRDTIIRFEADSIRIVYSEKMAFIEGKDTILARWTPLLSVYRAVIDTTDGVYRLDFSINASREMDIDTIAEFRKENVIGLELNLDSFLLTEKAIFENNAINYNSKIYVHIVPTRHNEHYNGNYPLTISFGKPEIESDTLYLNGKFVIVIPTYGGTKKYNYFFTGDFHLRFPMK